MKPFEPPTALLEAVERMLGPLRYNGPCNVDFTIRACGAPAVFEINPRFGGSLFRPANRDRLKQALRFLVDAQPPEHAPGRA
jgi:hypothetical protein